MRGEIIYSDDMYGPQFSQKELKRALKQKRLEEEKRRKLEEEKRNNRDTEEFAVTTALEALAALNRHYKDAPSPGPSPPPSPIKLTDDEQAFDFDQTDLKDLREMWDDPGQQENLKEKIMRCRFFGKTVQLFKVYETNLPAGEKMECIWGIKSGVNTGKKARMILIKTNGYDGITAEYKTMSAPNWTKTGNRKLLDGGNTYEILPMDTDPDGLIKGIQIIAYLYTKDQAGAISGGINEENYNKVKEMINIGGKGTWSWSKILENIVQNKDCSNDQFKVQAKHHMYFIF